MTRRQFARTAGIFTAMSYEKIVGANNRINFGFIGTGGRGTALMEKCCLNRRDVNVAAVCDVYTPHHERAATIIRREGGRLAVQFRDFRYLLGLKEIDAVVIATPDHWHALMTIMACQAGKDIYLEKPISHSLFEEAPMIKAMKDHQRIVQVGTQQQSDKIITDAVNIVRSGTLGKINYAECWIYWAPDLNTDPKDAAGLDWDMWLGPAPYTPYDPARAFFSWRYFLDYGGGKLTDWAAHFFTEILAATNHTEPLKVTAVGGIRHKKDHRNTPDDLVVTYDFGNLTCVFKHAPWGPRKVNHGIEFTGPNGTLIVDRKNGYKTEGKVAQPIINGRPIPLTRKGEDRHSSQRHMDNFVQCIKTRDKPVSSLEDHRATKMAHLGNIAYLSGQTVFVDPTTGTISPAGLHKYLSREYRPPWKLHLIKPQEDEKPRESREDFYYLLKCF